MARSLLKRMFGRDEDVAGLEAFHLPGSLHESVRLLLVDSGDPTDLLFAMPFVSRMREACPQAHLGLVCDEATSHLALTTGLFQDIVVVPSDAAKRNAAAQGKLHEVLRSGEWEVAILTGRQPDPVRETLARASGARLRVGPGHERAFPNLNLELRAPLQRDYPFQRTATWGRVLGIPLDGAELRWPLVEEMRRQMAQLVHFNKPRKDQLLVGIDPGVGKEGLQLATENLAFLVNHLASHIRCKTILLTAGDPRRPEELRPLLKSEHLDLPRPTLKETTLLLAQCDLFLAPNTDLLHFAVALDVPTLGIFTERDREEWTPPEAAHLQLLESREGERLSLGELMEKVDHLLQPALG